MTISRFRQWLITAVLGLSAGIIFILPYLREVFYKPLGEALGLTNTELGVLMSTFGIASTISYIPGGWVADRVSPRKLITVALLLTGGLGLYFATFPGYGISIAIHAAWGISIPLLFWGALIRATRSAAPPEQQGRAFGVLEMTRGIADTGAYVLLLAIFVWVGSGDKGLAAVIVWVSLLVIALGVVTWFVVDDDVRHANSEDKIDLAAVLDVLRMPVVWLIALVVLTAYSAYWTSYYFTPYQTDVFLLSAAIGGMISTARNSLKLAAAVIAGFLGDRFGIARSTMALFAVLVLSYSIFAFMPADPALFVPMLANIALAAIAIFALRGIYFALLEEGGVPLAVTGTATGVISAIGFTPDIFMPLLGGVLLDAHPGVKGYQYLFLMTAGVCVLGFVAAWAIQRRYVVRAGRVTSQALPPDLDSANDPT